MRWKRVVGKIGVSLESDLCSMCFRVWYSPTAIIPFGKRYFPCNTWRILFSVIFCYYSSLSDLIQFQALSWSGRRKLRSAREIFEQRLPPARPIPLSFFFVNPACSFVLSLRTEGLETAISDRASGIKQQHDLQTYKLTMSMAYQKTK